MPSFRAWFQGNFRWLGGRNDRCQLQCANQCYPSGQRPAGSRSNRNRHGPGWRHLGVFSLCPGEPCSTTPTRREARLRHRDVPLRARPSANGHSKSHSHGNTPTPGGCISYEAESGKQLTGVAVVLSCPTCSHGLKVGYVGNNSGTLQFNGVSAVAPGRYSMTIAYANGDPVRYALLSVNGGPGTPLSFPSTGSFHTVGSIQTTITLNTGINTLEFSNPIVGSWAPDFDQIQFNCPTSYLGNIRTRSFVQTGANVMIGGFIVQGTQSKRVILRAIGPELSQYGVPNPMCDPTLELHDGAGALIASNDNWPSTIIGGIITSDQVQDIQNTGLAPADVRESAIIADLPPGRYTAIVRGVNNTTGVALVEAYDLSPSLHSILGNIQYS